MLKLYKRIKRTNQNGLTLIEVMAAVVILSIAVLSFTMLFSKNVEFSHREENRNAALTVARTVIEELKPVLPTTGNANIFGQQVLLASLRDNNAATAPAVIYYPSAADRQYRITITDLVIPASQSFQVQDKLKPANTFQFNVRDYFSHIQVQVDGLTSTGESYTLQSYIERNEARP
ncbi:prepilin-type N-terminal cleavage/methylation domain-containing protein [Paenibacillus sp. YYML68]|uniref:type IV pilus modification PilV family protein n=1 Tax=Paenibacillus sp. YYML68 TaxID=2909250 RepID=UPI0037C73830